MTYANISFQFHKVLAVEHLADKTHAPHCLDIRCACFDRKRILHNFTHHALSDGESCYAVSVYAVYAVINTLAAMMDVVIVMFVSVSHPAAHNRYTSGFLTAVLQGIKCVIYGERDGFTILKCNPHYAAHFFMLSTICFCLSSMHVSC